MARPLPRIISCAVAPHRVFTSIVATPFISTNDPDHDNVPCCARSRQGPSPRPTSPSTRFAPTLCHSATWASPPLRSSPSFRLRFLMRLRPSPVFASPSLKVTAFMFTMPPTMTMPSVAAAPHRVTRLLAFGDFAPLAPSASLARASPITISRITIISGDFVHVHHAARRDGDPRHADSLRTAQAPGSARCLRQHRPAHPVRLAALVIRAARCGLRPSPASASRPPPVSSSLKATLTACSAFLPSPPSTFPAVCCGPRPSPRRRSTSRSSPCPCSRSTSQPIHFEPARCCLGSSPPATSHHSMPSALLSSSSSPASAPRPALVSGPVHAPPSVCSTRPPSLPPALSATQSPCRLPAAGSSGDHSPSLVPMVSSFPTACAGSGFHTRRS